MQILKNIPYLVIILLLGYVMFLRECTNCPECPENDTIIEYVYNTDTIKSIDTAYMPEIIYQKIDCVRWVHSQVDTAEILKNYFTLNYYSDTLVNDTNALVVINDTITQNRILSRVPAISIYPHILKETTYIKLKPELRNKVFLGAGVGRNMQEFGLSANIGLMTKKDNLYILSYDAINKDIYLSLYWKLKLKK